MTDERETHVRERAYQIWESEGSPEGLQADHWQQAEQEIDADAPEAGQVGQQPVQSPSAKPKAGP